MSGGGDEPNDPGASDAGRPSLGVLFKRLLSDGEAFVRAEVQLYRAHAMRKAFSAGLIVALIGGAVMLAQGLIITVLIGMVMVLVPSVGIGLALLIVSLVTIVLISLCVLIGRSRILKLLKPEEIL